MRGEEFLQVGRNKQLVLGANPLQKQLGRKQPGGPAGQHREHEPGRLIRSWAAESSGESWLVEINT